MKEKILNYIGQDGLLHILCCTVLVSVIGIALPLWVAIIATFVMGVAKELVWDLWLGRGTASWKDVLCDLIGIAVGAL